MSQFDEDLDWFPWTDKYGLVHTSPNNVTGEPQDRNGVLYTSEAYVLRWLHGTLEPYQIDRFSSIIQQCFVDRGILGRGPGIKDQEGPDDYIGAAAGGAILGVLYIANNILWRGLQFRTAPYWWWPFRRFWYNNVRPGTPWDESGKINWSAWLGRNPAWIAHFYVAAHARPPLFYRIFWALGLLWTTWFARGKQDPWTLGWLMVQTYGRVQCERSWMMTWAARRWIKAFRKQWPGGMKAVQLAYLQNPLHPFTLYWEDFLE
jgi:hypothetical protein